MDTNRELGIAKLPSIKNINKEDIPAAPEWVESIINPLNQFMREVYYALDRDLTINENMQGAIRTISFRTRTDYLTASPVVDGFVRHSISSVLSVKPSVVAIGQVIDTTTFDVITDPVSLSWDFLNGDIRINHVAGLKPSIRYEIKLLIF